MKIKRLAVATSIFVILAATGCSKAGSEKVNISPMIADAFTINAEMCYDGIDSEAIITRLADGIWQAEFMSPNTLAGVILVFEGENVSANYKGLSFSVPKNALPYKAALLEFFEVTDNVADKSKLQCERKNDKYIINGATDQGDYILKLDRKSGSVSDFSMPNINLEMKLTDYSTAPSVTTPGTGVVTDSEGNTVTNIIDNGDITVSLGPDGNVVIPEGEGNASTVTPDGNAVTLAPDNGGNASTAVPENSGTKPFDLPDTADR